MQIEDSEFFRQVTLRICSSLNIDIILSRCMRYLKQYIPISGMFFGLYEPELNVGRLLAAIWPEELKNPGPTISFPAEFWDFMKKEWRKQKSVVIVNDVAAGSKALQKIYGAIWPPDFSHLSLKLMMEQKRIGRFGIFAAKKYRYTQQHADLIELLHDPLAIAFNNVLQHQEINRLKEMLADDNRYLKRQMLEMTGETIIGANFGLKNVIDMVTQVAPLNSPVLLMGETGVGKEVIANAIHYYSGRKENPFIKVNCGAIPENLIDSELFGHEKGAFTGALNQKRGRFERAHTGTIFLDEVGELPLHAQLRLLRVLQQREVERVGGTTIIPVDVRIISATNRNLAEMVKNGQFREDLWFRLNVFPIIIPPLRQRVVDIPALVSHFLERKSHDLKVRSIPPLASDALETLRNYHWPGNVRELENIVERALILNQMNNVESCLSFDLLRQSQSTPVNEVEEKMHPDILPLEKIIARHIQNALVVSAGKVEGENGAAKLLGLHPSTLRGKMKKLGISYGRRSI